MNPLAFLKRDCTDFDYGIASLCIGFFMLTALTQGTVATLAVVYATLAGFLIGAVQRTEWIKP